jgi:hypothetical protein
MRIVKDDSAKHIPLEPIFHPCIYHYNRTSEREKEKKQERERDRERERQTIEHKILSTVSLTKLQNNNTPQETSRLDQYAWYKRFKILNNKYGQNNT